jgi:hypothetical protein
MGESGEKEQWKVLDLFKHNIFTGKNTKEKSPLHNSQTL